MENWELMSGGGGGGAGRAERWGLQRLMWCEGDLGLLQSHSSISWLYQRVMDQWNELSCSLSLRLRVQSLLSRKVREKRRKKSLRLTNIISFKEEEKNPGVDFLLLHKHRVICLLIYTVINLLTQR